ncbi:MAG: tRNA (adenosine(37)-N6)-dimethylallyltransferase MiaA [Bacteroidales bacterium]|nr:tRNA (adenosine(37)-N6)-dimethylallyltransferase MiaA [Bacteroidales bacterium]
MNNLVVLIGPTAVGKTETSFAIAEHFACPIISADSRQMYRGMEIGTAMPTKEELARHRHFFVGQLSPGDYYSAAKYETDVLALLEKEFPHHPTMLLAGGSMMYIDAVCNGIDDIPTVDDDTRAMVLEKYEREGIEKLAAELRLLDPEYYNEADIKNPKRVMHALEICYMTGKPYSSFRTQQKKERPFNIIKIGLQREREELYARINSRVDRMIEQGLIEEVGSFVHLKHHNSLNTVGYKEIFKYLDGEWTLPFAIEKIKQNTRIYSRKQMTWYRKCDDITWFHPGDISNIIAHIEEKIHRQR